MSGPELKPCPFCRAPAYDDEATARIMGARTGHKYAIACREYEHSAHGGSTMAEAIAAWNTRAPVDYAALPEVQAIIAGAVAKEREACAALAETHLRNWSAELAKTFGEYISTAVSGQFNGRKMNRETALKFAAEFRQRAEAVLESAGHTAAAIRKRGEGQP